MQHFVPYAQVFVEADVPVGQEATDEDIH